MKRLSIALPWVLALTFALLFIFSFRRHIPFPAGSSVHPPQQLKPTPSPQRNEGVLVTRVIDGDTIEIEGGTRVRYIGIDTPELDRCFGPQATEANKKMVAGKRVRLETDVQKLDKYQRTLAYVWVEDTMINEELVAQGFAKVSTFPPNVRYTDRFLKAQQEARKQQIGLWAANICASTPEVEPQTFDPATQGAQTGCQIKGNISSSGEKIYHIPGQRYYEKTKIEEDRGERWFCTEEKAQEAGWRKSKI